MSGYNDVNEDWRTGLPRSGTLDSTVRAGPIARVPWKSPNSPESRPMSEQASEFWDWSPIRPRRFTLVDLMAIVAMAAVLCAAIAATWNSDLVEERKTLVILLSITAPILLAFLWLLSGVNLLRSRWLDGVVSLVIILLTVGDAL